MKENKNLRAFAWSFIDGIGSQGTQLIIAIILARMLTPEDFGFIAIASIVIYLSNILSDSGLSSSLIRQRNASDDDFTTVFYTNISIGVIIYALIIIASSYSTYFIDKSTYILYIKIYGVTILFTSLEQIQKTKLMLDLNFKQQTKATFLSVIVSGITAIALAYYGYGLWALILQSVSASFVRCLSLWINVGWIPKGKFTLATFNKHFTYGYKLLLSNIIDIIYKYTFNLIIGKFYSISELGNYNQATRLSEVPSITISTIIRRVNYPIISKLKSDNNSYNESIKLTILFLATSFIPACIWISLYSHSIIHLLLGNKWFVAGDFLSSLIIAFMLTPITNIMGNVLQTEGRSDLYLKLRVFNKITTAVALFFVYDAGMKYILFLIIISNLLELLSASLIIIKLKYINPLHIFDSSFVYPIILSILVLCIRLVIPDNLELFSLSKSFILLLVFILAINIKLWKKIR